MRDLVRSNRLIFFSPLSVFSIATVGCTNTPSGRGTFHSRGSHLGQNPFAQNFGTGGFGVGLGGPVDPGYAAGALLIGALLGAFFSQRLKKLRKWIIAVVFAIAGVVFLTYGAPFAYAGWLVLGFVITWMLLRVVVALTNRKSTLYGSAEWADRAHLEARKLVGDSGLWLGTYRDKKGTLDLNYTGDRHLLTIAPTRAGKGVAAIIPNLLTYKGSAIVIDPKGENAMITAEQRRKMGQAVHVVDPWGITGETPARFNPLEWLRDDDPDVAENALMLAESLILRSSQGESKFWDDEAAALLWGFILYAAIHPEADERTLGAVRGIITSGPKELEVVLKAMANSGDSVMESTAARTIAKDEKMRANIFTTLQAHTHFLDSPRMRESLSVSDFQFEDLKTGKGTVYLVLPADRLAPFGRWLRLVISQAITVNARNIAAKPDKPILFLLDEMAALDKLQKVEEAFGLMAGFGMQLWGIAQDASQLKRVYGDGWETFVANAGVLQYFGSRDEMTAGYFSKLCGVGTEIKQSITSSSSKSSSSGMGGAASNSSSAGTSMTTDHIQRQLAFPDELMRLGEGKEILLIENHNPIVAEKLAWFADPRLKDLGVSLNRRSQP